MPRVKYTLQQRAEAVALGRVMGSAGAAAQLGMDRRTVRDWMAEAGDPADDPVPPGEWSDLLTLSLSRVKSMVAAGKLPATQVAVIAGIAARNLHHDPKPTEGPEDASAKEAEAALDARYGEGHAHVALVAMLDGLDPDALDLDTYLAERRAARALALDEQLARNEGTRRRWEADALIRRAQAYLATPMPEGRA